jgi:hypothetical protein
VFPRLGPTCRLVRSSAAGVLARGCRDKPSRRCWRQDVRLLGFGPAGRPFPAVHRPRYSFCAEGRRDARAVAALGFGFLSQGFGVAGLGSPLPEPFRRGLSSAARSSLQRPGTSRRSSCPLALCGASRLVDPAAGLTRSGPASCMRFAHRPGNVACAGRVYRIASAQPTRLSRGRDDTSKRVFRAFDVSSFFG